jgi:excisionase family DNA binding protein
MSGSTTDIAMSISSCGLGRDAPLRELYSPREVEKILGISHPTLYRLIGAGRLDARKIGNKTVITDESIRRFIAQLPSAKIGEASA